MCNNIRVANQTEGSDDVGVVEGELASYEFTAPDEETTLLYWCEYHGDVGMEGQVIIRDFELVDPHPPLFPEDPGPDEEDTPAPGIVVLVVSH